MVTSRRCASEAVILLAMIGGRYQTGLLSYEELRFLPTVTLRPAGEGVQGRSLPRA
jgi:hypothetical protein